MNAYAAYRYLKLLTRHGPLYPFWTTRFPRRILDSEPIYTSLWGDPTVCVLTSGRDWLTCLWTLASFYRFSGRRDPLLIYGDGTLTPTHEGAILRLFPNARIVDRSCTDPAMAPVLAHHPRCGQYRDTQPFALRIIDLPAICESHFILMLDSDVLFFEEPVELLARLADRKPGDFLFQNDFQDAYAAPRDSLAADFGVEVPPALNCGILLADISDFRYDWIEAWLARPGLLHHCWSEQTLWAMYAARHRPRRLSDDYAILCSRGIRRGMAAKHYVKPIRDLLYVEGIPHLSALLETL